METGADGVSNLDQRGMSLPTREQRMFDTSLWTIAPTGFPYPARSIQHFLECAPGRIAKVGEEHFAHDRTCPPAHEACLKAKMGRIRATTNRDVAHRADAWSASDDREKCRQRLRSAFFQSGKSQLPDRVPLRSDPCGKLPQPTLLRPGAPVCARFATAPSCPDTQISHQGHWHP